MTTKIIGLNIENNNFQDTRYQIVKESDSSEMGNEQGIFWLIYSSENS